MKGSGRCKQCSRVVFSLRPTVYADRGSVFIPAVKQNHYITQGFWVLVGLLVFLLLEKMFPDRDNPEEEASSDSDLNFNSAVGI